MEEAEVLDLWAKSDVQNCGGYGSIMIQEGPNQLGECCPGCPSCDKKGESRGFDEWLKAQGLYKNKTCVVCGGSGKDPHIKINRCPECRGSGYSPFPL